jgi:hypothetical protein
MKMPQPIPFFPATNDFRSGTDTPRDGGLVMSTVRSADEVRPPEFAAKPRGEADADMVAIAETIIRAPLGRVRPGDFPRPLPGCAARTGGRQDQRAGAGAARGRLKRSLAQEAGTQPKQAAPSQPARPQARPRPPPSRAALADGGWPQKGGTPQRPSRGWTGAEKGQKRAGVASPSRSLPLRETQGNFFLGSLSSKSRF